MFNMGPQYHTKMSNEIIQALRWLKIPLSPGNFVHYNFLILHYISHKIKYDSLLRVVALTCSTMLLTLPEK